MSGQMLRGSAGEYQADKRTMVSVCLSSDALLQHLPSYLGFSYLGHGVSLHGCSSKAQPLLLTLDKGISSPPPFLTFNVG